MNGSSLADVKVNSCTKRFRIITHKVFSLNNTNGLTVSKLDYNQSAGIVTCTLVTPLLGFSTAPFSVDEEIFVEGITKE